MNATPPLSGLLKDATADAHRRAESGVLQRQMARGVLDEDQLIAYLGQLHRIHACLERGFDSHVRAAASINWCDEFRHSRNIQADLDALGAAPGGIPHLAGTRRLLNQIDAAAAAEPAALLGFHYVLEGSMNGNRFLARALRRGPAGSRCALAYFDPYGDEQPARWATFKATLDGIRLDPGLDQVILAAALRMFEGIAEVSDELVAGSRAPAEEAIAIPLSTSSQCP